MGFIDLHVHSNCSDGTLSPSEVTDCALLAGLTAYALTDHDTVDGISEAKKAADGSGLEVVPGAELSCNYKGKEIHMLGLYIDASSEELLTALKNLRSLRERRNEEMLRRFREDGFSITEAELCGGCPGAVITRAHFARVLVEKGYVSSTEQAFKRYLEHGKKYCPPKENFEPEEAIRLIRAAGGFPALAHPMLYKLSWKETELLITTLKAYGLMGVEVYYSSHHIGQSQQLQALCRANGLLPTGGSDFHGANKPDIRLGVGRGNLRVTDLLLDDIRQSLAAANRRQPV